MTGVESELIYSLMHGAMTDIRLRKVIRSGIQKTMIITTKFYMDLGTGYCGGGYYIGTVELKDKIYVFPGNARHLLIIKDKKIRKVEFLKYKITGCGVLQLLV